MLAKKHWNQNDTLKAPEGLELLLHVHASGLVYHGWPADGDVWESLLHMFLDTFLIDVDDRTALINQLKVIMLLGVQHSIHYIKEGWDTIYSEENMKVLSSLLEIKMILGKNPNV